jgi:hypothetical protein
MGDILVVLGVPVSVVVAYKLLCRIYGYNK